MPTVWRYTDREDKSGFYIRTAVEEDSIITLQTKPLANEILSAMGFSSLPPGENEDLSPQVYWVLKKTGLLYTQNSGVTANADIHELQEETAELPEQVNKLIEFLKSYDGPEQTKIQKIYDTLKETADDEGPDREESEDTSKSEDINEPSEIYSCKACGKKFEGDNAQHRTIHHVKDTHYKSSSETRFECECGEALSSGLKKHIRLEHLPPSGQLEKSVTCEFCKHTCSQNDIVTHVRRHHTTSISKCTLCETTVKDFKAHGMKHIQKQQ